MFGNKNNITVFDFGSKSTKVLYATVKDKSIHVEDYEIIGTPQGAIKDGKLNDVNSVVNMLSTHLKRMKGNENRLLLASSEVVLRTFEMPKMGTKELKEAVKYEMSVLLPESLDHFVVDASIIDEYDRISEDGKEVKMNQLQGVAVNKKIVNDYLDFFNKHGGKISVVDVQSNAEIKLFTGNNPNISPKNDAGEDCGDIAIIDFGHQKTGITILEDKKLFLHRTLHKGGFDITNIISETLDLPFDEAEKWKHTNDFEFLKKNSMNEVESILYDEISNVFHDITMEISQIIEFFISMSKQKKLDRIYLVGGGSLIPGFTDYIHRYVNIPVELVLDLDNVTFKNLRNPSHVALLADSIGAVIRRV
ncbi:pilus assembly protein PilM [Alkalibacter mobilis]|uniref:pilus assembly protein PilM n=1 Tax=Alkalibacter mobilis TaxID=2787712 RepID=UPI00189E4979|nr:pilus assembly protein PilM [Alkalibacter mobilis]MBF7095753.1 pilus assembly protein PilM [Alkalibacter mobilis]